MANLAHVFENLFFGLASDIGYTLSKEETNLYIEQLEPLGLSKIAEACLVFREESPLTFPSIREFQKVINDFI